MAADNLSPGPRRLLGLAMLGLVVLLLVGCIAAYNKVFTSRVPVTVQIAQVDNSFEPQADVRYHGVTVGEVSKISTDGRMATLNLELDPALAKQIPSNVDAQLLPESLFGERYVSLVNAGPPSTNVIQAGMVIPRDRSSNAIQIETVFNNLLPLLEAVRPADIASTLGAVSQGLSGKGEQLGNTIQLLHQYLSQLNPVVPRLTDDLRELPGVTDTYSKAAPDLIEGLRTLTTTTNTIKDKRSDFEKLYRNVTDTSDDLRKFLDKNKDTLVAFLSASKPTLNILARYSPEYVCLFTRLQNAIPLGDAAFGKGTARPALHVSASLALPRGKFVPHQDEPDYTDNRGPRCYDNTPPLEQYPGGPALDGSTHPGATTSTTTGSGGLLGGLGGLLTGQSSSGASAASSKSPLLRNLPAGQPAAGTGGTSGSGTTNNDSDPGGAMLPLLGGGPGSGVHRMPARLEVSGR
jgi:phospholipid/cholesterol/gamma-HCH transport system substrate-binding protein